MTYSNLINILAIIVIPLVAVWLGRHLQNRAELRRDKMEVFKSVMTFRYGWSTEGVKALNNIHIVFFDDQDVRKCWRKYYAELCKTISTEEELNCREEALYALLESMAKNLGYTDSITKEDIRSPYVPQGMVNTINNSSQIQANMASIVQQMNNNMQQSQKHIYL